VTFEATSETPTAATIEAAASQTRFDGAETLHARRRRVCATAAVASRRIPIDRLTAAAMRAVSTDGVTPSTVCAPRTSSSSARQPAHSAR
jgi:hypothetical protein